MAARIVPEGGWQSRLKPMRTPRVKNDRHRQFIKTLPCVCCLVEGIEQQADDPMHIRSGSDLHGKEAAGGGQTSDDRWTLPGCRPHHNQQHAAAELRFWADRGIDPFLLALTLWGLTGNYYGAVQVLRVHAALAASRKGVSSGWWRTYPVESDSAPAAS